MLKNITKFSFLTLSILVLNSIFITCPYANDTYQQTFEECFPEKYDFTCEDRYGFLKKMGINIEEDLIDFNDLTLIQEKSAGTSKGGIYANIHDRSQIYFVKKANAYHEIFATRLMSLIVNPQTIPTIKLVKNKSRTTASLKLHNFTTTHKTDFANKQIVDEVLLIVAMDYLGIIDRHANNMGYVTDGHKLFLSRVDFDAAFDFESTVTGSYQYASKKGKYHLDLKHLYVTMQTYPKYQIEKAMQKIVDIPDEKIIMIGLQTWGLLSQTPSPKNLEKCLKLAKKLIERKEAFKSELNKSRKKHYKKTASMFQ